MHIKFYKYGDEDMPFIYKERVEIDKIEIIKGKIIRLFYNKDDNNIFEDFFINEFCFIEIDDFIWTINGKEGV